MDKPKCRYCEKEMTPRHEFADDYYYVCLYGCGSRSPIRSTPQDAWEAAVSPPKARLLTLEEVVRISFNPDQICFLEEKGYLGCYANPTITIGDWQEDADIEMQLFGFEGENYYKTKEYGKTWRCWSPAPTADERMALPWEKV